MSLWLGMVHLARPYLGQSDDTELANAACYTCANGVDAPQYGIPAADAANLQAQGWDCRRDECSGGYGSTAVYDGFGMGRIPLARGLGRRALQG